MNILIISIVMPYPMNSGGTSGVFLMADYMRKRHKITFLCPKGSEENEGQLKLLWPDVDFVFFESLNQEKWYTTAINNLKKYIKPKNTNKEELAYSKMFLNKTNLVKCYLGNFIDQVKSIIDKTNFDIIQTEFIELAPIIDFLPKNAIKTFVHHEIRYRIMKLEYATLKTKSDEVLWMINNTQILEIGLLNKFDKVFCVTQEDVNYLTADGLTAGRAIASPSPVKTTLNLKEKAFPFKEKLVYLGPEFHYPNTDAVDWFLENCWERLLAEKPNLKFDIIGKWTPEAIKYYSKYKNVAFHGFVEDLSTYMSGAILIVPLRIGSGMRMKILEGIKWQMPIVTTSIGCEGLPMKDGENCLIGDSVDEFFTKTLELVNSETLQQKFVNAAKSIALQDFSIEQCGELRQKIYESLL